MLNQPYMHDKDDEYVKSCADIALRANIPKLKAAYAPSGQMLYAVISFAVTTRNKQSLRKLTKK